jgi:hypothetical protein
MVWDPVDRDAWRKENLPSKSSEKELKKLVKEGRKIAKKIEKDLTRQQAKSPEYKAPTLEEIDKGLARKGVTVGRDLDTNLKAISEAYLPKKEGRVMAAWDEKFEWLKKMLSREQNAVNPDSGLIRIAERNLAEHMELDSREFNRKAKQFDDAVRRQPVSYTTDDAIKYVNDPSSVPPEVRKAIEQNKTKIQGTKDRSAVPDTGVRSNKTMKPGRLARKVWEETGGHRSAVLGPEMGPPGFEAPRIARAGPGGIHAEAADNMATSRWGRNAPEAKVNSLYESYGKGENYYEKMGFTNRDERYVSRREASARQKAADPTLSKTFEQHSGRAQQDRLKRQVEIGQEALIGEERRAPGEEGERIKSKRSRGEAQIRKLDAEAADLKRKNTVKIGGKNRNVMEVTKTRKPTFKHSPIDISTKYHEAKGKAAKQAVVTARLKDIDARRQVLQRGIAGDPMDTGLLAKKARAARGKVGYDTLKMVDQTPKPVHEKIILKEPVHVRADRLKAERAAEIEAARVRRNSPSLRRQATSSATRRIAGAGAAASGAYLMNAYLEGGSEALIDAAKTEAKVLGATGTAGLVAKKAAPGVLAKIAPAAMRVAGPLAVASTMYEAGKLPARLGAKVGGYEVTNPLLKNGLVSTIKSHLPWYDPRRDE